MIRDLNSDLTIAAEYLNGIQTDDKLRQTVQGTSLYLLTDALGSTRAIADDEGSLNASVTYGSFGDLTSSPPATRYTFTGREFDTDTKILYYRARWYDPDQGRFISEDPLGFDGNEINLYAYVGNDPVNSLDPFGLQKLHGDLDRLCNGDCADIERDMTRLAASIAARSAELSFRRRSGLGLDPGHTKRLANERRTLERCQSRYQQLGCDKQSCPPIVPAPVPKPAATPTPVKRDLKDFRLRPGILVPTPEEEAALRNAAVAGNLTAVLLLLLLIMATAP